MAIQQYTAKAYLKQYETFAAIRLHKTFFPAYKKALGTFHKKKILDIGCGNGTLTKKFADAGATVVGIDNAKEWEHSWNKHISGTMPLSFKIMNATNLHELTSNSFDAVTMNMVILNLDSRTHLNHAFSEVARVLKRNGTFVFSNLNPVAVMQEKHPDRTFSYHRDFNYWKDGSQYTAHAQIGTKEWITFVNRHWTLETITTLISTHGLYLEKIIEPKRPQSTPHANDWKVPEFILFVCKKK